MQNPYYTLAKRAGAKDKAVSALTKFLTKLVSRWYIPGRTVKYPATGYGNITREIPSHIRKGNVAKDLAAAAAVAVPFEEVTRRFIANPIYKARLDKTTPGNYGRTPEAEALDTERKQRLESELNAHQELPGVSPDEPFPAAQDTDILKDIFTRGGTYKGGLLGALAGYGIGDWIQPKRNEGRKILDMLIGTAGGAALGYGIDKFFDQPKQG